MMNKTSPSILQNIDSEISLLIAKSRGISKLEALRIFLNSEGMLAGEVLKQLDDKELTDFVFNMYELYYVEAIENAYKDMDCLIQNGKPVW